MSQKIYIAVNKDKKPFMFIDEPVRTETSWKGNYYVNSVVYAQIVEMVAASGMTHDSDPEVIEFQIS